jgi:hypothetical protein
VSRFGHRYVHAVANPDDILMFRRTRRAPPGARTHAAAAAADAAVECAAPSLSSLCIPADLAAGSAADGSVPRPEDLDGARIEELVEQFLRTSAAAPLVLLSAAPMSHALLEFVESNKASAIAECVPERCGLARLTGGQLRK